MKAAASVLLSRLNPDNGADKQQRIGNKKALLRVRKALTGNADGET